jgi:hypothetical protein
MSDSGNLLTNIKKFQTIQIETRGKYENASTKTENDNEIQYINFMNENGIHKYYFPIKAEEQLKHEFQKKVTIKASEEASDFDEEEISTKVLKNDGKKFNIIEDYFSKENKPKEDMVLGESQNQIKKCKSITVALHKENASNENNKKIKMTFGYVGAGEKKPKTDKEIKEFLNEVRNATASLTYQYLNTFYTYAMTIPAIAWKVKNTVESACNYYLLKGGVVAGATYYMIGPWKFIGVSAGALQWLLWGLSYIVEGALFGVKAGLWALAVSETAPILTGATLITGGLGAVAGLLYLTKNTLKLYSFVDTFYQKYEKITLNELANLKQGIATLQEKFAGRKDSGENWKYCEEVIEIITIKEKMIGK